MMVGALSPHPHPQAIPEGDKYPQGDLEGDKVGFTSWRHNKYNIKVGSLALHFFCGPHEVGHSFSFQLQLEPTRILPHLTHAL